MKKFFFFVAAALLSTAMFADAPETPSVVPSTADFNAYKADGANVVVGFYTYGEVCNDLVFTGTYNEWATDPANCTKFEAMDGFEGWYVCSFTDASEEIKGKPVQSKPGVTGNPFWDYQINDVIACLSGTVTIKPGYAGEVNLEAYGTDAPVVLVSGGFKMNPCAAAKKHDYKVTLDAPYCANEEGTYYDPAISGNFNDWGITAMVLNEETMLYEYSFNDEEGHKFKFRATEDNESWDNQIKLYNAEEDSWYDNPDIILGEVENLSFNYSEGKYGWCVEETAINNVFENAKIEKVLENGQLIIKVDGVRYTTTGARL